jgi:SAM-dependent methyltransferase
MKNFWTEFEGDNWFLRNKNFLGKGFDMPLFLMELYLIKPGNVLEVGAANGYRLAKIHEVYNSDVTGIEPSRNAIEDGISKYPFIRFIRSTCECFDLQEKFDLIIVNFVFHWIYRENLYVCVNKIDQNLKEGGYLILGDFGPEYFFKRKYHHLKDANFYTWKMSYWELFTRSGKYLEIAKLRFNHDTHKLSPDINIDNMGTTVLLKKQDLYIER